MSLNYEERDSQEVDEFAEQTENAQYASFGLPYYSIILISCFVLVFICQIAADGVEVLAGKSKNSALIAGFVKPFFTEGQFWRILTGATLHGGIMHILFNSYALYSFGRLTETLSNRAHLAIVFLFAAIGGGVLSFVFLPDGISVGASGGIVGLLGYMTVYSFKRRKLLPEGFLKNMLINIGIIAAIGIFLMPNIDNFAHLGGLIVGLIYGFIQIPNDLHRDPRETSQIMDFLGLASIVVVILSAIFGALMLIRVININLPAS